jgi:isopenicillin N synthase-like dioxygenase
MPAALMQVNVADLMEIYTNGVYPATRHRVVVPEEELIRRQPRQSLVFFLQPDAETVARQG